MTRIQKAVQIMDDAVRCKNEENHKGIWDNLIRMTILACSVRTEFTKTELLRSENNDPNPIHRRNAGSRGQNMTAPKQTPEAVEMKPCPFCGGKAERNYKKHCKRRIFTGIIQCGSCLSSAVRIEVWNRRSS